MNLAGRAEQVSAALIAAGIEAGDRVALWAPNGAEWMLAALGALSAGAVLVPVSTRFTGPEALDVILRSRARALFVAGNFLGADRLGAAVRRTPVVVSAEQRVTVTVSIGVAVYPEHGSAGAAVLEAADDALYAAKAAGRDTYQVAPRPGAPVPVHPGGPGGAPNGTQPPRQSRGG